MGSLDLGLGLSQSRSLYLYSFTGCLKEQQTYTGKLYCAWETCWLVFGCQIPNMLLAHGRADGQDNIHCSLDIHCSMESVKASKSMSPHAQYLLAVPLCGLDREGFILQCRWGFLKGLEGVRHTTPLGPFETPSYYLLLLYVWAGCKLPGGYTWTRRAAESWWAFCRWIHWECSRPGPAPCCVARLTCPANPQSQWVSFHKPAVRGNPVCSDGSVGRVGLVGSDPGRH